MEISSFDKLLQKFKYPLSKVSRSWLMLFGAMLLLVFFGLIALVQQIIHGHIVTGMRDHVVWGLFIINFIFFLGIGYSGAILGSVFHLTRIRWSKPLHHFTELFAVTGLIVGPIFIFLCIGRLDRIFYIFQYARIQSPITWDVIAIMTNLIFIATYLYIAHIRDFAKLRDSKVLDIPNWKRKFIKALSLGYSGKPEQIKILNQSQNILAVTILFTAILADSLLAWLFGMSLRPGWHSTLFAPEFILVALYSGVAMLILMMWIYRQQYSLNEVVTDQHFYVMGFALLILCFGFAYFTLSEYITEWYNVSETHGRWIEKFLDFHEYGLMSLLTIAFGILIPIVVLVVPKFRTPGSITVVAILVLIGLYLKRYLIIVPTLETPFVPIQDLRPEYVHYHATWVEWALTGAGFGLFVLIIMILNLFAPAIPVADLEHDDEIIVPKPFYETLK
ncbi:MAG: polysulfide reductase NrfD [Saprospiraceae bacterium]|nr:polysulfide reductase NrfD [Saprospiraceae bacterium]